MSCSAATPSLRPCLAVICLWAQFCSVTHFLPSITALIAWLDNQHHVSLRVDSDGSRVILTHDQADGPKSAHHAHGAISRILVMCSPSPATDADHLVDFSQTNFLTRRSLLSRDESMPVSLFVSSFVLLPAPAEFTRVADAAIRGPQLEPPDFSVAVARTTVILV